MAVEATRRIYVSEQDAGLYDPARPIGRNRRPLRASTSDTTAKPAHVRQRRGSHSPKDLPNLPPPGQYRSDVAPDLSGRAALGSGHQAASGPAQYAAMVYRPGGRNQ